MPKYTDGKRVITATEKAYEVLYKARGFEPYEEKEAATRDTQSELLELTKDELLEMAEGMGLEVNSKMTKAEIVAVIEAVDAE